MFAGGTYVKKYRGLTHGLRSSDREHATLSFAADHMPKIRYCIGTTLLVEVISPDFPADRAYAYVLQDTEGTSGPALSLSNTSLLSVIALKLREFFHFVVVSQVFSVSAETVPRTPRNVSTAL
jgi:hypothetical protein